jgi:hypothetical protein
LPAPKAATRSSSVEPLGRSVAAKTGVLLAGLLAGDHVVGIVLSSSSSVSQEDPERLDTLSRRGEWDSDGLKTLW